jgi:hypothetical protein
MTTVDIVQQEARVRTRYAAAAAAAAVLIVISAAMTLSGPHTNVNELTLDLITAHKRFPLDLISYVIDGLGFGALGFTLVWLHDISKARNPEIRSFIRWLALVGAALSALIPVIYEAIIASKASTFVHSGTQTYLQAYDLTKGGWLLALPLAAQLGSLLLTGGFIWISLNSMRVGLLTRYLGYTGVIAGVLVLFQVVPVPVVQAFWLLAIAALFAGRWPTGTPPAWEQGVAIPWPASSRGGGGSRGAAARQSAPPAPRRQRRLVPSPPPAGVSDDADEDTLTPRTRANTPKRKRKRRN